MGRSPTIEDRLMPSRDLITITTDYQLAVDRYTRLRKMAPQLDDFYRSELEHALTLDNPGILTLQIGGNGLPDSPTNLNHYISAMRTIMDKVDNGQKIVDDYHAYCRKSLENRKIDGLTGLILGDFSLEEFTKMYLKLSKKSLEGKVNNYIGIIHADLNDFKEGNSKYGHPNMNSVLAGTGEVIRRILRNDAEQAIRVGGDEILIFTESSVPNGASKVAEKIRQSIQERKYSFDNGEGGQIEYKTTASLGYTSMQITPEDGEKIQEIYNEVKTKLNNPKLSRKEVFEERDRKIKAIVEPVYNTMYRNADEATYHAKVWGKNNSKEFNPRYQSNGVYRLIRELYDNFKHQNITLDDAKAQVISKFGIPR